MSDLPTPSVFASLAPATVWKHFVTLCAVPRASKQEAKLRQQMSVWAAQHGLAAVIDSAGNLVIRKPASAGREHLPGVILQAHLDMVCQNNTNTPHDFSRDPILPVRRGGWLVADGTTLGADNGIGVALIMAVLEDTRLQHGPIEALFTVDEEAGMGGAHGLQPDTLNGRLMLNLDTERWGEFYLGCAGGLDVNVRRGTTPEPVPEGWQCWRIDLHGLRGGHSGVDIHEERGNAIKLLVRVLCGLEQHLSLRLASLSGGTARNALPREAFAIVAVPSTEAAKLVAGLEKWDGWLRRELAGVDEGVKLGYSPEPSAVVLLSPADQGVWLASLQAAPHGVRRMSRQLPGVVETSNNLGMVKLDVTGGSCNFMVRSLLDSGSAALADEIVSLFALSGTVAEKAGHYPGWSPNPDSRLLSLCRSVYRQEFGSDSRVQVIHAGLECGIIGAKYPGLDIVSFGPTIRGAHAPGESVEIETVGRCWQLLQAILTAVE
ncbi:MAG: aminoacyl-histidine dipeptidase [Candidatus Dechloromonas phosphoritropha]